MTAIKGCSVQTTDHSTAWMATFPDIDHGTVLKEEDVFILDNLTEKYIEVKGHNVSKPQMGQKKYTHMGGEEWYSKQVKM